MKLDEETIKKVRSGIKEQNKNIKPSSLTNKNLDKTKFCDIFGYSPESKILEYLLEVREEKLTFNDIVNAIGVNRKRAYEILKFYLKSNIIEKSDKIKQIQFYKLNVKNQQVKTLMKLFDNIIAN